MPKTNQIIDTQIWQLEGQPDNLETRKVLFNWDYYNNLIELYEVEPISDWENRFSDGGEIIINPTEIECHTCHWKWKVKDGGDDLFIWHKCYADNTKFYKFEGLEDFQGNVLATAGAPLVIPAGFTVPIFVTSASLSSGAV